MSKSDTKETATEAEYAIEQYDALTTGMVKLQEDSDFIPDTSTKEGYTKSKQISIDIGKLLAKVKDIHKQEKKFYLDGGRAVDAQAREVREALEAIRDPHKLAYQALDQARKDCQADVENFIAELEGMAEAMADCTAKELRKKAKQIKGENFERFNEHMASVCRISYKTTADLLTLANKADAREAKAAKKQAKEDEKAAKDKTEYEDKLKKEASAEADKKAEAADKRAREAQELAQKASDRAREVEEGAERVRIKAEKKAAKKARKQEKLRQEEEIEAEAKTQAARKADKKNRKKVNHLIVKKLMKKSALPHARAVQVMELLINDKIPHTKVTY